MFKVYALNDSREEVLIGEFATLPEAEKAARDTRSICTRIDGWPDGYREEAFLIKMDGEYLRIDSQARYQPRWEVQPWLGTVFSSEYEAARAVQSYGLEGAEIVTLDEEMSGEADT